MNKDNAPTKSVLDKGRPSYFKLYSDARKHKALYYKILPITFLIVAFITICIPNYYTCEVKLAPELSGANGSSSLSSLASSFGFNVGNGNFGADAIIPTLYPDLMNSVAFRASLFPVIVQQEEGTSMSYYDYLLREQKRPWWSNVLKWISDLFVDENEPDKVNPFRLTKEQYSVVKIMEKKVLCSVEKKNSVITISVTDQDPLIAATMADSIQERLQNFITDYRTCKAKIDLEYNRKLFKEAQVRYEQARRRSAAYNDANQHVFLDRIRSEQTRLENEMNLQYQAYSQIAAQLRLAEAKVQENTPAFTILQPSTVPIKKAGPPRSIICIIILFFAFLLTTAYSFYLENDLLPFLGIHRD